MNINDYATDLRAEQEGKWFEFDGSRFLIAAALNPRHRKVLSKLGKTKHQAAIRKNDPAGIQALSNEAMAEAVLLGWEGVKCGEQDYPFTPTNALALITTSRVFRDWLEATASDQSQFVQETEAAAVGDLKSGPAVADNVGPG